MWVITVHDGSLIWERIMFISRSTKPTLKTKWDKARFKFVAMALSLLVGITCCSDAFAMRYVRFEIMVNGKVALKGG
jgi:hypothetical protein